MAEYTGAQLQASIIPVFYKRDFLEEHNVDIVEYAKKICSKNRKNGKLILRHDVEWYWEAEIRAAFDALDTSHHRLINQIRCPKFDIYWTRKTATAALQAKEHLRQQQEFWLLKPKTKEKTHLKSALILGNNIERWIVPDVSLMAIDDVFFDKFVQSVRAANVDDADNSLDDSKLLRLWGALIKQAYDFVPKEVQIQKLKEAFSLKSPTTEAEFEEFFGPPSKKRKAAPSSRDDTWKEEKFMSTQKEKRVSFGESHVRRFDKESILDLSLKPILKYTFIPSPHATAEPSDNTSPGASAKPDEDESGERTVDPAQERIQQLEKELAELKVAKSELEDRYQCERGMRRGAEMKISWLEGDLKESQDLVAQLEKRSIETI